MTVDRSFVEQNRTETERMRNLVARLSDDDLNRTVGEHWTVGVTLAHLAFWDQRVLLVLNDSEREGKVTAPPVDIVVNDILLPLFMAIPPREAARIAVEAAEKIDQRLETYPPQLLEEIAAFNLRWVMRSLHRIEHLDEVEHAIED